MPPDYTPEEYFFIKHSIADLYCKISNPTDKFLVAFLFELNYSVDMAAESLGKSNGWVSQRTKKIKAMLSSKYKIKNGIK